MKRLAAFLLAAWLLILPVFASPTNDLQTMLREAAAGIRALLDTDDPLAQNDKLPAGDSSADWLAMTFALAGEDASFASYGRKLQKAVRAAYRQRGTAAFSATDGQRIVLTTAALGLDPTSFGGVNLVADYTYGYIQNGNTLSTLSLNACIFALLSLDCKAYPVPDDSPVTRQALLRHLLDAQNDDGSLGLTKGGADADLTAMAVQALAPYINDPAADEAVGRALTYLTGRRNAAGDFPRGGAETIAQTIIAVCAVGLDPRQDVCSGSSGVTLLRALEKYRLPDGSFAHTLGDDTGSVLATQQAMLALLAMQKLYDGKAKLYDFSDIPLQTRHGVSRLWIAAVPAAAICAVGIVSRIKRRRNHHV